MSAFTEANRKAFDDLSDEYDSKPWRQRISQQITEALQWRKDWIGVNWIEPKEANSGRKVRLLDYACGTGSVTKVLGPWVTSIHGIDISENMVKRYNDTAQSSGLEPEQANAVVGDLLADEIPPHLMENEYYNFDIVAIGLGFHHFDNPLEAIKRLTERLKAGTGVLLIVDFLPFDTAQEGPQGAVKHTIEHGGFAQTNMKTLYTNAGLENFSFSVVDEPAVMQDKEGKTFKRDIFIARGKKQTTAWNKWAKWCTDTLDAAGEQAQIAPRQKLPDALNHVGGRTMEPPGIWERDYGNKGQVQGMGGFNPGENEKGKSPWKMVPDR